MINSKNYYDRIKSIDMAALPQKFQDGHEVVNLVTGEGKTWKHYEESLEYKGVIDTYFKQLDEYLSNEDKAPQVKEKPVSKVKHEQKPVAKVVKQVHKQTVSREPAKEEKVKAAEMVERIPEDLRFIKRFVNLHDKVKTKDQILSFLKALQKAIVEKRVRKTSPHSKHIEYIQDMLIDLYQNIGRGKTISIAPSRLKSLQDALGKTQMIASIPFIKRFINLHGKPDIKEKAGKLYSQMEMAVSKKKVTPKDPYFKQYTQLKKKLFDFYGTRNAKVLELSEAELNGLEGILDCACQSLNGIDDIEADNELIEAQHEEYIAEDEPRIMNSMDFANVRFITIGLKGKWQDLIGDPTPGFTAMVFGKPKMGKSYLCVEFAGYLARHHGKVLYVAKEEGLDATLQLKTKDRDVAHPNLTISDGLPKDLSPYDYVFLDSVTKLRLSPEDLERLEKEYPGKSFIYIFQTTKGGNFRGANAFQHEVDIVIEIPEKGIAIQNGRFNQGGQIGIFSSSVNLDGIRKKSKKIPDWTEPKWLNAGDHMILKRIRRYYEDGDFEMAMDVAMNADTVIRDEIPASIWKRMGGMLTPTGEERLRKEMGKD